MKSSGPILNLAIFGVLTLIAYKIFKDKGKAASDLIANPIVKSIMNSDVKVPAGNFVLPNGGLVPVAQTRPNADSRTVQWSGKTYRIGERNAQGNWPLTVL